MWETQHFFSEFLMVMGLFETSKAPPPKACSAAIIHVSIYHDLMSIYATGGKIWGKNCWVISQLVVVFWLLGKPWSTSLQVPKVLAGFAFTLNIYLYSDIWRKFSRSIFIGKYIYIYIYAWWLKSLGSLFVLQWVFRETRELADVLGKPWLICLIPTPLWG